MRYSAKIPLGRKRNPYQLIDYYLLLPGCGVAEIPLKRRQSSIQPTNKRYVCWHKTLVSCSPFIWFFFKLADVVLQTFPLTDPPPPQKVCNIADLPPEDLQHCRSSPFHCRSSPGNLTDLPHYCKVPDSNFRMSRKRGFKS